MAAPENLGAPQQAEDLTADFELKTGFAVERVYEVPSEWGSWVALTKLGDGDLAAADQYGGIYRVRAKGKETRARKMKIDLTGAHALLWHRDSLYVTVTEDEADGRGIYRVRDLDGDGEFEKIEKIKDHNGGGEHGAHSLVPSPDGEWIYLIAGNKTDVAEMDRSWVARVWDEDHLLPRNPDGRGHGRNFMAPGGWIARFRPDGSNWEFISGGFRNPFDMAFNEYGDLFAYDADMEWDFGMPWYRPTRLCRVIPGSEFGWRNGTGKWPEYYEDSLNSVVEFGPGSPTGVVSGKGAAFPAKYQRAIFCFDWTFATIYAVHLTPDGAGYQGEREEFLSGAGLPLTDGVIGEDGALYFATGGRRTASALWRIRYVGKENVTPVPAPKLGPEAATLRAMMGESPGDGAALAVEQLGSEDRTKRFAARVVLETAGVAKVRSAEAKAPLAIINKAIALCRVGDASDRSEVFRSLMSIDWSALSVDQKLSWLRASSLMFIRLGAPESEERDEVLEKVDASFPADETRLNAELCRLLSYLQAPNIVGRTLRLMAEPDRTPTPDWARLVARNARYGAGIARTLRDAPPIGAIHFAYCLRVVVGPWTEGQRRQLMEWYAETEGKKAGNSYGLFLERMKEDTLSNATPDEREMIESWGLEVKTSPFADLPRAKGPGRDWKVEEVVEVSKKLEGADLKNGKQMFKAALCMACHRVDGEGGASGPDLSVVAGRFTAEEFAVAIIHPSKEISDQFEFSLITKNDGSTVYGKILDEKDKILIVAVSALDLSQRTEVARIDIKSIEPSGISPMPPGLLSSLNEEEVRDMLAWLLKR